MLNDMSKNTVAVCVTGQMGCDKLIRAGRELADRLDGSLVVMSARLYNRLPAIMKKAAPTCQKSLSPAKAYARAARGMKSVARRGARMLKWIYKMRGGNFRWKNR